MGCIRSLVMLMLFVSGLMCAILYIVLHLWTRNERQSIVQVIETPEKDLRKAMSEDGPAWVKVKIEPASKTHFLLCGDQPCVWKTFTGEIQYTEEIKKEGRWITRNVWKPIKHDPEYVPILLTADGVQINIEDWVGIEVHPDILRERSDKAQNVSTIQIGSNFVSVRNYKELYLPVNTELWTLGKWIKGRPTDFIDGRFHFTSLGKERFAQTLRSRLKTADNFQLGFLFFGLLFLGLFIKNLLKSRNPPDTIAKIESMPDNEDKKNVETSQ